jgi:hypothetical protein
MVRFLVFIFLILIWNCCFAYADDRAFSSCDKKYSIVDVGSGNAVLDGNGRRQLFRVGHSADGGAIDQKHSLVIVYGTPKIIDPKYPQTVVISLFKNINHPRLRWRTTVGGGVYDAAFSLDGKFAVVNYKNGTLIIDIDKNKSYMTDSEPPKVIKCE